MSSCFRQILIPVTVQPCVFGQMNVRPGDPASGIHDMIAPPASWAERDGDIDHPFHGAREARRSSEGLSLFRALTRLKQPEVNMVGDSTR